MENTSNADEESLSTTDRIKWLRERGIQVTIPGEVNTDPENAVHFECTVVKIPYDDRLPFEEHQITLILGKPGDQYMEFLKPFFKSDDASYENLDKNLLSQVTKDLGDNLSVQPSTILNQLSQGAVEAFPLSHPCKENKYERVNFYLDEASQLKMLPSNPRAIALARLCGFENVPLAGDIFIGRYRMDNQGSGPIRNLDFHRHEMDSSATWLKNIQNLNYSHGIQTNMVTMENNNHNKKNGSGNESQSENSSSSNVVVLDKLGNKVKWSQNDESVEIVLRVPTGTGSKEIKVHFQTDQLIIALKKTPAGGQDEVPLLDIVLCHAINKSDCTWTLNNNELELSLEKRQEGVDWESLEKRTMTVIE